MRYCLGKLPPKTDARRLSFAKYAGAALPATPPTCDRTYGITDWGMMANDQMGNCAYASPGHMAMAWHKGATGNDAVIPDSLIIAAYAEGTGYDPRTGAGDNGASLLAVQEQWRVKGFGKNKIAAYGALDSRSAQQIREAVYYYGAASIGLTLPETAIQQMEAGLTWTVPWFSPMLGGHAVPLLSYDEEHLWCITWGKIQPMTWEFFHRFCDEAYCVVNPLWIGASGVSPSNLNLDALIADLSVLG